MSDLVLYELHGHAGHIILNRPQKHNCITLPMLRQFDIILSRAAEDRKVRAIVICGAGDSAFSSGADLNAFNALSSDEIPTWIRIGNAVLKHLWSVSKPTIAMIQGYAYGAGLELALACDFRIATPAAKFCSPELKRGWIPGWGGLIGLRSLLGEARAKEVALLGDVFDGSDAVRIGLVTRLVPLESSQQELRSFIDRLAAIDSGSFAAAKALLSANEISKVDVEFQLLATLVARISGEGRVSETEQSQLSGAE